MNVNVFKNRSLLYFLGGVAVGALGPIFLKSDEFKRLCLLATAKGLKLKNSAGVLSEELQEKFADFVAQAAALGAELDAAPAKKEADAKKDKSASPKKRAAAKKPAVRRAAKKAPPAA